VPTISNSDATQGDVGQVKVVCLGTDDPTCNGTSCGARPKLVSRARVAGVSRGAAGDCLTLPRILNFELLAVRRGFFSICNFSAKQATHNNQHDTHHPMDVTTVARSGVETRAGKRTRERDAHAGEAIPGLPLDVVVSHVLREENLPDPTDLAWLRTVSRAMCDAVAATGRRIENLDDTWVAANRGWLSTLKRLHRRGVRFDAQVCCIAAKGGHLEVLQWLRENSCPWDWETCLWAAMHGHLKVLQWARANGCPWSEWTCRGGGEGRAPRGAAVVAHERLPVGPAHVRGGGDKRTPRGATVGARKQLSVGRGDVRDGGGRRAPRGAEMVARKRLPVGPANAPSCKRAHTGMGGGERLARIVRRSPVCDLKSC
jgi:hypothetical protein